jgi:hypothetical protein
MGREFHVRFREGLGVKFPRATRLIITGTSRLLLRYEVQPLVEHFLAERGLELSHEKTRITHVEDGFDFLGQTLRRQRNGKVLLKPSKRSVKTFLSGIQATIDDSGNRTAGDMIRRLNQQIKGWAMYHRFAVSSRTFAAADNRIFWKLRRWCRKRHRGKSWGWIKGKYFQHAGDRDWAFTGVIRDGKGKGWPGSWATPLQVGAGSSTYGRGKEAGVWCAGRRCKRRNSPGTSTIGGGAASGGRVRSTTWSCCTPTATGRSTHARGADRTNRVLRGTLREA